MLVNNTLLFFIHPNDLMMESDFFVLFLYILYRLVSLQLKEKMVVVVDQRSEEQSLTSASGTHFEKKKWCFFFKGRLNIYDESTLIYFSALIHQPGLNILMHSLHIS